MMCAVCCVKAHANYFFVPKADFCWYSRNLISRIKYILPYNNYIWITLIYLETIYHSQIKDFQFLRDIAITAT